MVYQIKNDYVSFVYFLTIDLENKKVFFFIIIFSGKLILEYSNTGIDIEKRISPFFLKNLLEPLIYYF